eukprot:15330725-Ditylum_brightwellii.AAC.1
MKQLHDQGTFKLLLKDKLTMSQRSQALPSLIFLKEKKGWEDSGNIMHRQDETVHQGELQGSCLPHSSSRVYHPDIYY